AENLGFAIPSLVVRDVVDRIIREGRVRRAWTGLRFQALKDFGKSSYIDATHGVLVASVDEDSPAERAKLRAGDIAVAVDGAPIHGMYETDLPAIERRFASLAVEQPVRLDILRGSETLAVSLSPATKGKQEGEDFECKKWDLTVKEITKFSDPYLYFQKPRGAFIQGVKFQGNARVSGLLNFDVILTIGDRPIESLKDVRDAYDSSLKMEKGKRKLLFRVLRAGYRRLLVLDFEKDMEKLEDD
ncbi:MAG TPA: PDZ domain-containing protein, partial [Planctomycetota bacterium]|nr:PDZ domain-containing protein [Planctomycetota bacterium]